MALLVPLGVPAAWWVVPAVCLKPLKPLSPEPPPEPPHPASDSAISAVVTTAATPVLRTFMLPFTFPLTFPSGASLPTFPRRPVPLHGHSIR